MSLNPPYVTFTVHKEGCSTVTSVWSFNNATSHLESQVDCSTYQSLHYPDLLSGWTRCQRNSMKMFCSLCSRNPDDPWQDPELWGSHRGRCDGHSLDLLSFIHLFACQVLKWWLEIKEKSFSGEILILTMCRRNKLNYFNIFRNIWPETPPGSDQCERKHYLTWRSVAFCAICPLSDGHSGEEDLQHGGGTEEEQKWTAHQVHGSQCNTSNLSLLTLWFCSLFALFALLNQQMWILTKQIEPEGLVEVFSSS